MVQNIQSKTRIWIGGSDADREGEWVWTDGDGNKMNITVSIPWVSNEPNGGKMKIAW